jgi:aspartate ammonia-lyase
VGLEVGQLNTSAIELLQGLAEDEVAYLMGFAEVVEIKAGDVLFNQGEPRQNVFLILAGEVEILTGVEEENQQRLVVFGENDTIGEAALVDNSAAAVTARAVSDARLAVISRDDFPRVAKERPELALHVMAAVMRLMVRRTQALLPMVGREGVQYATGATRMEHDLLGDREVPEEAYYGVQSLRGMENYPITRVPISQHPDLIRSLAVVKAAAAAANKELGLIPEDVGQAIIQAAHEIKQGKLHNQFVVDCIQGGAGTSTNMNANEVIANRALELLGHKRGEYQYCHPNNHVNCSQSTNDAYPTALRLAAIRGNEKLTTVLEDLVGALHEKGEEFSSILKMGRTQLQDAVPMTLGQEFHAYADNLAEEIERLNDNARLFLEVNLGGTAIGTGINAHPEYRPKAVEQLRNISGLGFVSAPNLIEATDDMGAFVMYSSALKRLAVKLSKICNDLRLLSSGPRCGFNEINLPAMAPGSSIMPGKVNPVIPEVVNQVAFKVIGNDLTVTIAAEAGQLELNVMEPVIAQSLFESVGMLQNAIGTLMDKCVRGITANEEVCSGYVRNSIGLVTALVPVLGYEVSSDLAKTALRDNRSVYDLVRERELLSQEELDRILDPENMIAPSVGS